MPPASRTLSATEFSEITGVSRERLRTWERRHGFPDPVRVGRGSRRYRIDDVARVVAVRRSVDHGVPLQAAVDSARDQAPVGISDSARTALAEHAPVAVVVVSGPEPIRIEEVNALVRSRPGAPHPGDELLDLAPWYGDHPGLATLRNLFASSSIAVACEHPDWTAGMAGTASAIAYRLPQEAGTSPLVALIGIDTARERRIRRELGEARDEQSALRAKLDQQERWTRAKIAVVDAARDHGGLAAVTESTEALVRYAGIIDAALATYMTGALVVGRSGRGRLGPSSVPVSAYEELAVAMRESTPTWLSPPAARAVGASEGIAVHLVPVVAAGEPLGALLLLFEEPEDLEGVPSDLLTTVATMLGYVLLRERVLTELRP